jgi:hypothetical protein
LKLVGSPQSLSAAKAIADAIDILNTGSKNTQARQEHLYWRCSTTIGLQD